MIFHQIVTSITPFLKHKCPAHSICDVSFGLPWKILKRFEVGRPFYGVNYSQLDLTWHHFLRSWTDFIPFWKMSFCNCFLETQLSCFRSWRVPGLFLNHMQSLPCSVCCGMIYLWAIRHKILLLTVLGGSDLDDVF